MDTVKIQTRAYQNRHQVIRNAFNAGYEAQCLKTGDHLTNEISQNNRWYSIISAAKVALGCDIYASKMADYMYVLGALHADNLPITGKNIVQREAIALYDYYNNLQVDSSGKAFYYGQQVRNDPTFKPPTKYKPQEFTASQFKEILVNDHISISSSIRTGTLYSWFYKQGLKMDDLESYPAYIFARVIYLAVCNAKVLLLPNGVKVTPFLESITTASPEVQVSA